MGYYDEQLQLLQKQVADKKRMESKLAELYTQQKELSVKVVELKKSMLDEQNDVERLEGHSLTAFIYGVIGKMDEKMDKEREEAYAAAMKYEVTVSELTAVESDVQHIENELSQMCECEQKYERILKSKAEAIKSEGSNDAVKIFQTERQITCLEGQMKEIHEALSAGEKVLNTTNSILESLDKAENWGTWDLLGGGMISDIQKHSHLDEAQNKVEKLQIQLRQFKTEMTDITIHADIQVSINGFLGFADYFFDGFFADSAVLDKITQSQAQVQNTKSQVNRVLTHLTSMLNSTNQELENEKTKLKNLIVNATI